MHNAFKKGRTRLSRASNRTSCHGKEAPLCRAGYTLLELIVVLMLMSLILGISAVYFSNSLPTNRFNSATRDLAASFRQARALARIQGKKQILTFDLDNKQYGIEGRKGKTIPQDIEIKIVDPVAGDITEGKYRFIIQPLGAGGGTIVVWDDKRKASIKLDPVAGALTIR